MRFKHFKNITEGLIKLTPGQLDKLNSKTKEPRIDILARLIKQKEPLELAKGGTMIVADIDSALDHIKNFEKNPNHYGKSGFPLIAADGKEYKSNDLGKSAVFGGGGGSGSGTHDTARNESHNACMMKAMADDGSGYDLEHFDEARIAQAFKDNGKNNVDVNTDKILESPEAWVASSYYISKWLVENGYINKNQIFDRGGPAMTLVYTLKNQAYKNNGFKPLNNDKWNPGDVWAVEKGFNILKNLDTSSVQTFNKDIMEHFNTRKLVAISLKGPVKKENPYNKEFNNVIPPDTEDYKYLGVELQATKSGRGTFWSRKGSTLKYDGGSMSLRDPSPGGANRAEIDGKSARGGGIGWGEMQEFVKREVGKTFPKHGGGVKKQAADIKKKLKLQKDSKTPKPLGELKHFWKMYNYFYPNETYGDFLTDMQMIYDRERKPEDWYSAKLGSLYVCYFLDNAGGKRSNAIITHFVNYAGSNMLDSSTYIKVGK